MKRWLGLIGGVLLALVLLVAVLLFTPLLDPDLRSRAQPIGSYSEAAARIATIKAAEAQADLIPEADSIALLTGSRAATSVVIFHGYTSVPRQFRLIAEGYRAQGYNVWVPRLPYHGERDRMTTDFSKVTAQDLRRFADDNVDIAAALGEHVVVIGFSGGGSLGAWSGVERPEVSQTILISPLLHPLGIRRVAGSPARSRTAGPPLRHLQLVGPCQEGQRPPRLRLSSLLAQGHRRPLVARTLGRRPSCGSWWAGASSPSCSSATMETSGSTRDTTNGSSGASRRPSA